MCLPRGVKARVALEYPRAEGQRVPPGIPWSDHPLQGLAVDVMSGSSLYRSSPSQEKNLPFLILEASFILSKLKYHLQSVPTFQMWVGLMGGVCYLNPVCSFLG